MSQLSSTALTTQSLIECNILVPSKVMKYRMRYNFEIQLLSSLRRAVRGNLISLMIVNGMVLLTEVIVVNHSSQNITVCLKNASQTKTISSSKLFYLLHFRLVYGIVSFIHMYKRQYTYRLYTWHTDLQTKLSLITFPTINHILHHHEPSSREAIGK